MLGFYNGYSISNNNGNNILFNFYFNWNNLNSMNYIKITLPIYYTIEKKTKDDKTILVGMNWYRNVNRFVSNDVKKHYHQLVKLKKINKKFGKIKVHYVLFPKQRNQDAMNIISVIDKFVLDGFQKTGMIENDNSSFYIGGSWRVGEIDTINPRIEIFIEEI